MISARGTNLDLKVKDVYSRKSVCSGCVLMLYYEWYASCGTWDNQNTSYGEMLS